MTGEAKPWADYKPECLPDLETGAIYRTSGAGPMFLFLTLLARAADKGDDEQTLRNAATVLQAMVASKDVPASVVAKADCIIILPSVNSARRGLSTRIRTGLHSCLAARLHSPAT